MQLSVKDNIKVIRGQMVKMTRNLKKVYFFYKLKCVATKFGENSLANENKHPLQLRGNSKTKVIRGQRVKMAYSMSKRGERVCWGKCCMLWKPLESEVIWGVI